MFFLAAVVWFIIAIVSITVYSVHSDPGAGTLALGLFGLVAMVICFLAAIFMKRTVIDAIDQGRFHDAKNDTIIWIVFGLIGIVLPALFLMLTYVKLSDSLAAQQPAGYAPYAPGTVQVQQPAYVPPPAPIQPPPAAPASDQQAQAYHAHQTPMVRCKNCSVQYPMFMHSCPNCGAPKE